MKSIGIVRDVDRLGRIVIPMELRKTMHIAENDPLEIYVDGDNIVLRKYEPACLFCGTAGEVVTYKDRKICKDCLDALNQLSKEG